MDALKALESDPNVGSLVITRRVGEWLLIDSNPPIAIQVTRGGTERMRLRVLVDRSAKILRYETYQKDQKK